MTDAQDDPRTAVHSCWVFLLGEMSAEDARDYMKIHCRTGLFGT